MAWTPTDLKGRQFGDLAVLEMEARRDGDKAYRWRCRCVCGVVASVRSACLLQGRTKSCGCRRWRLPSRHGETFGNKSSPEYTTWRSMKQRCLNPKAKDFQNYGGRGISVCARWADDFTAFLDDMGRRPTTKHSLDRIDTNGDYEPSNCRWATKIQQQNNLRSNRPVTIAGNAYPSASAARRATGQSFHSIRKIIENA